MLSNILPKHLDGIQTLLVADIGQIPVPGCDVRDLVGMYNGQRIGGIGIKKGAELEDLRRVDV